MLFTPESVLEARRRLTKQMQAGTITEEQCFQQALQLDPFDAMALTVLGRAHYSAGDRPAAEEKFWRAVAADPSRCEAWFGLDRCVADRGASQALHNGVLLLAARKMLRNEESTEEFVERLKQRRETAILPPGRTGVEVLIAALVRSLIGEPAEVTALLRPHRLIDELLESAAEGLDPELVDQIVAEGVRSAPLLIGVLRAMATGMLPPDDPSPAAASVALLGEIGDPAAAPGMIEFCSVNDDFDDFINDAAEWAVLRLAARRPEETYQALRKMAVHAKHRSAIASLLAQMPARPDRLEFVVSLLDGIDALPKADRQDLFLCVADTILMIEGQRGKRLARSLFDRYARLLPRGTQSELQHVEALNDVVNAVPLEPGSGKPEYTVYDYCSGFENDEEENEKEDDGEFEDFIPATIKRSATPGRNDPCWCGSGKKYKKCHLSAPS
jgi:tetratricopeptide (TPR) repeat protein